MTASMLVLTMTNRPDVHGLKMDVKAAFTKASPSRVVYSYLPEGIHAKDSNGRDKMVAILANLYGSVEAARRWLLLAMEQFALMGFKVSAWDACTIRIAMPKSEVEAYINSDHFLTDSQYEFKPEIKDSTTDQDFQCAGALDDTCNKMAGMHFGGPDIPEVKKYDFSQLISSMPDNQTDGIAWVSGVVHVDDFGGAGNHLPLLIAIRDKFLQRFPGTFEHDPDHFLGLAVRRESPRHIHLSQPVLLLDTITAAKQTKAHSAPTPMTEFVDVEDRPGTPAEVAKVMSKMDNAEQVNGQVGYLTHTRVELQFPYSQTSRIASNPSLKHIKQIKRVVKYMIGTKADGIDFKFPEQNRLVIFVDTNHGLDVFTGIAGFYNGGPVYVKTLRQKTTKISSFAAEGVGLSEAIRVAVYLRALIRDVGDRVDGPTLVLCDNQSAITVAKRRDGHTNKSRHYKIRMQWVRERIAENDVFIEYVPSAMNVADILTKPLSLTMWRLLAPQLRGEVPLAFANEIEEFYRIQDTKES